MEVEKNEKEETKQEEVHKETIEKGNPLDEAKEVLSKLEEQNKIMSENLERSEKFAAINLISGSADAGQVPKKETDEERIDREAKAIIATTGLEL
jgi:hypothetical protein